MDAPTREQKILTLAKSAGYDRDPFLKEFGFQMNLRMVEMSARVIPAPQILYNENNRSRIVSFLFRLLFRSNSFMSPLLFQDPVVEPKEGAWTMDGQILYHPANCQAYSLIALVPQREESQLQCV